MTGIELAAVVMAVVVVVLTAFQLALALGAPWGRAAYGGAHPGVLPTRLRITSGVATVVWPLLGLAVLRRAGFDVWAPVSGTPLTIAVWVVAGLLVLGTIANVATPSRVERALWGPTTFIALVATATVAVLAD